MATHSLRYRYSSLSFFVAIAAIISVLFGVRPAAAADANAAQSFVQQSVDRVNAILDNPSLSVQQRRSQLGQVMLSITDTRRIATFALGQYANSATPEQISAFQNAFADYATVSFESRLDNFKGGRITVSGTTMRAADDFVVNAEMTASAETNSRQPIKVAFRVRALPDGRFALADVEFEGIWLALSERDEFTAFLQQHNGNVAALTDGLRSKTEEALAGSARGSRSTG